jgi:circadian clock protein KaiC
VRTGIDGFDDLVGGGIPCRSTTLVLGGPGSGKTLFALEVLVNGARRWREPGIFVAFEERGTRVIANASSFGWDLRTLQDRRLFFLDARLSDTVIKGGEFDVVGLLAALEAKVREMGAGRIVFDGIDILLGSLADQAAERRELLRLGNWLAEMNLSGFITCKTEAGRDTPFDRYSYLPYLADCVVVLQQQPTGSVLVRRLRVAKCRGIRHAGHDVPFTITGAGLRVARYPAGNPTYVVRRDRITSGISRLDAMLAGGYYRNASVVISGAPGTAKSSLAAAFAAASASRGERTLYVTFDETPGDVIRNMASVNIRLAPLVRKGVLELSAARKGDRSAEDHVAWIADALERRETRCLIIDPISALISSGGSSVGEEAGARLIAISKSLGITLLATTLLTGGVDETELTVSRLSTLADTWIHLSYVAHAGERNRALTIVKSRGAAHSNQVRELILSDAGISLADVYLEDGEVLMGALRRQKEMAMAAQDLQRREMARLRSADSRHGLRVDTAPASVGRRRPANGAPQ